MNLHAYLHPMFLAGVLQQVARRQCAITGKAAILWDVTAHVPDQTITWGKGTRPKPTRHPVKAEAALPFLKDMSPDIVLRNCEELRRLLERVRNLRASPLLLGVDFDVCAQTVEALTTEAAARATAARATTARTTAPSTPHQR